MGSPREPNEVGRVGGGDAAEQESFRRKAEAKDAELVATISAPTGAAVDGSGHAGVAPPHTEGNEKIYKKTGISRTNSVDENLP